MTRFPRPSKARRPAGDGSRRILIVVATGAALGFGALANSEFVMANRQAAAAATPDDAEIYTGSILYMPDDGDTCRQLLFNNHNGQFTDKGYVDCERAAYHGTSGPKEWSAARMKVISSGFRGS
jgi:hypothetical protein